MRVVNDLLVSVPAGTLHEVAVDIDTNLWLFFDVSVKAWHHISLESQSINSDFFLTSVCLHSSSVEALWEEEGGHPVRLGWTVVEPVTDEFNPRKEILIPRVKRLQAWVGHLDPVHGHLVVHE